MKNKGLKTLLVTAVIITLTFADFALLGTQLLTYALENDNVVFTAYFKTEEGEKCSENVYYKTTTISKTEFDKVLGTNGTLIIKDQNGNIVKELRK